MFYIELIVLIKKMVWACESKEVKIKKNKDFLKILISLCLNWYLNVFLQRKALSLGNVLENNFEFNRDRIFVKTIISRSSL